MWDEPGFKLAFCILTGELGFGDSRLGRGRCFVVSWTSRVLSGNGELWNSSVISFRGIERTQKRASNPFYSHIRYLLKIECEVNQKGGCLRHLRNLTEEQDI